MHPNPWPNDIGTTPIPRTGRPAASRNRDRIAVVGAGLSGAVVARELAEAGLSIDVFDSRPHVAGNCHTQRDPSTGIMVHEYGPHLFHTSRAQVWAYVQRFAEWVPHQHRVKATTASGVYSMPINLLTINQFLGTKYTPTEAQAALQHLAGQPGAVPQNFEEQARTLMGEAFYVEFFAGYTSKQWGRSPRELPASVLKRLPMRFDYNDRYFSDQYEAAPVGGYTAMIDRILANPAIRIVTSATVGAGDLDRYGHVFWSGQLDEYFDHCFGSLAYRTLDFVKEVHESSPIGCAVMNFCAPDVAHTRISEHAQFSPWENNSGAVTLTETSREWQPGDIPYYPVRLAEDQVLLTEYVRKAESTPNVSFIGRLGTYRYLDMDASIEEALEASRRFLTLRATASQIPSFFCPPL